MRLNNIVKIDECQSEPLYVQIRDGIKVAIANGSIKSGDKLPGDRDIAQELGVSIKMVRQALSALVDEGLIFRRPRRGTIVGQVDASDVSRPRTSDIGVVFASLQDPLLQEMTSGIDAVLSKHGYHMILANSQNSTETEIENVNSMVDRGVDGLIVYPINILPRGKRRKLTHYKRLLQARIPLVVVDDTIAGLDADNVVFDNYMGAYKVVEQLVSLGHQKIAHLTIEMQGSVWQERIRGFQEAAAALGLPKENAIVYTRDCDHQEALLQSMIDSGVTAVFCATDLMGLAVCQTLESIGVSVPEQMSVVGFGFRDELMFTKPVLTTVAHPTFEMGYRAAETLLDRLNGTITGPVRLVLDTELVIGESTAPPKNVTHKPLIDATGAKALL